ncbi:MAG TPA: glycine zipper family protein [Paenibacillaceae bacterium]|nr:glycine zipper family protein [Paenibacillaceae bacterium]
MSMGISFGLIFGLVIFDNMTLWLSVGLCLGLAIGSGKDADAKKKGLII